MRTIAISCVALLAVFVAGVVGGWYLVAGVVAASEGINDTSSGDV